ncbi:MAG: hypothetical protein WKF65_08290 [Gaiellaceae bacterium]
MFEQRAAVSPGPRRLTPLTVTVIGVVLVAIWNMPLGWGAVLGLLLGGGLAYRHERRRG